VAAGESGVWVSDRSTNAVTRIDPDTHTVVDEIAERGVGFLNAVAAGGAIWLTSPDAKEVVRLDPHTNRITGRIPLDGWPRGITAAGDQIWVAVSGADAP
jgi:streptogramin lyase